MKREIRKVISAITTVAMVATLFTGVSFDRTASAADGDSVALTPWKFYQTGTTTSSNNPWELNAFSSVTFGTSGVTSLTSSDFSHYDRWSPEYSSSPGNDEKTVTASGVSDTFTAFIESNGWTADYDTNQNNPYTLSAYMDEIPAQANTTYAFSFKAKATSTNAVTKHIQLAVADASGNVLTSKIYTLSTTEQTCGISYSVTSTQNVKLSILMGAFPIETSDITVTEVNYEGLVTISNTTITEGEYDTSQDSSGAATVPATNKTQIPDGYSYTDLVWSDEFSDSTLNTNYWTYEIGNGTNGWGNGESENYTDSTENVYIAEVSDDYYGSIDNSALAIKAKRSGDGYTSGRIKTAGKLQFKYGYAEAKIKMDNGMANGVWPAFWMLGTSSGGIWPGCGEYDIMEHSNSENLIYGTLHWESNGEHASWGLSKNFSRGDMNDWHKYAMEWDENEITIYLDGSKVMSMGRTDDASELFSSQAYFILNVAIGGQFINWQLPSDSWSSSTMYVDYVRVYQKDSQNNKSFSGNWEKSDFWKNFDPSVNQNSDPVVYTGEANGIKGWTHTHQSVSDDGNDKEVEKTDCTDLKTGFKADISITGWSAHYTAPSDFPNAVAINNVYGDTPNQLRSETTVDVVAGQTYNFGFDLTNHMTAEGSPTEKNVTIKISGTDGSVLKYETIRVSAEGKKSYATRITIPSSYSGSYINIELDYGYYGYSYNANKEGMTSQVSDNPYLLAPGTTEPVNCSGLLTFKNVYCLTDDNLSNKELEAEADASKIITGWQHSHEPVETNDAAIANTVCSNTDTGFSSTVSITGWQGYWEAPTDYPDAIAAGAYYGDNPYQLHSYATASVEPGNTYKLAMDINNKMYSSGGADTEKNVTITVTSGEEGDTDNTFLAETVRIDPKSTLKYRKTFDIPASYQKDTVKIIVAYGCYAYSYNATVSGITDSVSGNPYLLAPGTVENVNASGKLIFDNTLLYIDDGSDEDVEPETTTQKPVETTTQKPAETTTQGSGETTTQKPAETTTQASGDKTYTTAAGGWNDMDYWSVYAAREWGNDPSVSYYNGNSYSDFGIRVNSYSGVDWAIQMKTQKLPVTAGKTYVATCKVTSSAACSSIQFKDDITQSTTTTSVVVGENTFTVEFTPTTNEAQIFFELSKLVAGTTFDITSFSIAEKDAGTETTAPSETTTQSSSSAQPIEVIGLGVSSPSDNVINVVWGQTTEMIANGQKYNVYIDGVKVLSEVICASYDIDTIAAGTHTIKVTAVLDGNESNGVVTYVDVAGLSNPTTAPAETTTEEQTTATTIEINGFQISPVVEGFRTVYTVSSTKNVQKVGLVYGLAGSASDSEMVVDSTNNKVFAYDATANGLLATSQSDAVDSASYAMTMKYGNTSYEFLSQKLKVRAYAVLTDGTVIYSDIDSASIYDVADELYKNLRMNSEEDHDYLYNRILKNVDSNYTKVTYQY